MSNQQLAVQKFETHKIYSLFTDNFTDSFTDN